jgi:hypothetical protein
MEYIRDSFRRQYIWAYAKSAGPGDLVGSTNSWFIYASISLFV